MKATSEMVKLEGSEELNGRSWDEPVKCARFIERFTAHCLNDVQWFDLKSFSRNDLESIIRLLHGYYTCFVLDSPNEIREDLTCSAEDVLKGMTMASSIRNSEDGEMILGDELWELIRRDPFVLKFFINLRARASDSGGEP